MFWYRRHAPTHPSHRITMFAGACALTLVVGGQALSVQDATAAEHTSVLVSTMKNATLGTYLDTVKGFTLYTYALDTPNTSNCTGPCATLWPPLLVPKSAKLSTLVHGVKSSRLGRIKRSHGKVQLTYEGRPLYRFAGDKSPGQTGGQGIDNLWLVALVSPSPGSTTAPTAVPLTPTTPQSSNGTASHPSSGSAGSSTPAPTTPSPTTPPPTTPPPTTAPPTSPPTTQPPSTGGYGY